jgi:hypothetical protein
VIELWAGLDNVAENANDQPQLQLLRVQHPFASFGHVGDFLG